MYDIKKYFFDPQYKNNTCDYLHKWDERLYETSMFLTFNN